MPGFRVGSVGSGAFGRPDVYTSYSWAIDNIFGTVVPESGSNPLIYANSISLPTFSVDKETYQGSALQYKFAKGISWDDVRVVWYDTVGMLGVVKKWREAVWDPEKGLRNPSEYKKTSTIASELSDGSKRNSWELINSWPSIIRHGELTYVQSDAKMVEVTVTYDWAVELPSE